MAVVVHLYAKVGVPVSTSQGIMGAVLGTGLLKGVQTINLKTLFSIVFGWLCTPLVAMVISYAVFTLFRSLVQQAILARCRTSVMLLSIKLLPVPGST